MPDSARAARTTSSTSSTDLLSASSTPRFKPTEQNLQLTFVFSVQYSQTFAGYTPRYVPCSVPTRDMRFPELVLLSYHSGCGASRTGTTVPSRSIQYVRSRRLRTYGDSAAKR